MKILMHSCCGPCTIYPAQALKEAGHEVSTFFYNPNIHPYTEYKKRLDSFLEYTGNNDIPAVVEDKYELEDFRRYVRDGKYLEWKTRNIISEAEEPKAGDTIIYWFVKSGTDEPGLYGLVHESG